MVCLVTLSSVLFNLRTVGIIQAQMKANTKIRGHKSNKTTEVYTHVSRKILGKIQSPLDGMKLNGK
jgi:integrase